MELKREGNCDNFLIMKVALTQFSPTLGNVKKNFEQHLKYIETARKKSVDLLIFPELSLTGYTLKDIVEEVSLSPEKDPLFNQLIAASQEISLILGFVEKKERGLFYNSAAFLSKGKILHVHRKVFLPTHGMFEEGKFFAQGKNFHTFSTPYGNIGMMICRDFLSYSASYLLFTGGSEIIVVISAAPGRGVSGKESYESSRMWELMGEAISCFSTAFVIYCNRIGFEDGKHFAGGSFIYNPMGKLIAKARYLDEDFLIQEINLNEIDEIRKNLPFKRDDKPEIILEALKRIIRKHEN